ncbi:MAG: alpha/beta hydrolase [Chloroflexota bacterium]|nr:alpha/beta hydrolase [Chloroflexota bacterium]
MELWLAHQNWVGDDTAERFRLCRRLERLEDPHMDGDLDKAGYQARRDTMTNQIAAVPAESNSDENMDALGIEKAVVAGYDWGGRAAWIVAALQPERVAVHVSADGSNAQHLGSAGKPAGVGAHLLISVLFPLRAWTAWSRT